MTDQARSRAIGELLRTSLLAGHPVRFRATGTSMLPTIWPGDVLTVAPLTPTAGAGRPAPGDVALTFCHDRLRAHRVIERRPYQRLDGDVALVTRGDALDQTDPAAAPADILGIVIARNGRALRVARRTPVRWLFGLARFALRATPLLALTLKLRALGRRLAPFAI